MSNTQKLSFPSVLKVRLHNFSLYKLKPNLELELPPGVFCLAGANGLGKTTFLATLNYGLTGLVPDLNHNFLTAGQYYDEDSKELFAFTKRYFDGRITQKDRATAAITVTLQINNFRFVIKRELFNYKGPTYLNIVNTKSGNVEYEGNSENAVSNHETYKAYVCKASGLAEFEQFVFLQHFILTFDESRKLVLWNAGILREALYICIGADYNTASQASELTKQMEQYSSRARNVQFQATNVRGRIEAIKSEFAKTNAAVSSDSGIAPEEVEVKHRTLVDEVDKLHAVAIEKQRALRDADLQWLERSAKFTSLHAEYEREFSRRVENRSQVQFHPTISATLSEDKCAICHSIAVAARVKEKIEHKHCPLCDSTLPSQTPDSESKAKITSLDFKLTEARDALHDILQTKERLAYELKASEDSEQGALAQLQDFESENINILQQIQKNQTYGSLGDMASTIARLEVEFTDLTKQKREHYNNRDRIRNQLEVLQKGLKRTYAAAEEKFVPMLQKLAIAFLGINISVSMEENNTISNFGVSLVLSMRGTTRRADNQLSESQRFFVDIALRMALVQYISAPNGKAEFLIDTPEGSLDIAYEARAGSMFAQFAHEGHNLFITANINSSHLLIELAKECGSEQMTLHRMTDWTELSKVQAQSEDLFNGAYSAIEAELV